jgi:hypothetical protein
VAGLEALAARMSEKQLDRAVRRLLRDLGLSEFSFHPPDGTGRYQAGHPDWFIAGSHGVIWRELKTERERLTPTQKAWIERLQANGLDVGVWHPIDLLTGLIATELMAISGVAKKAS